MVSVDRLVAHCSLTCYPFRQRGFVIRMKGVQGSVVVHNSQVIQERPGEDEYLCQRLAEQEDSLQTMTVENVEHPLGANKVQEDVTLVTKTATQGTKTAQVALRGAPYLVLRLKSRRGNCRRAVRIRLTSNAAGDGTG